MILKKGGKFILNLFIYKIYKIGVNMNLYYQKLFLWENGKFIGKHV